MAQLVRAIPLKVSEQDDDNVYKIIRVDARLNGSCKVNADASLTCGPPKDDQNHGNVDDREKGPEEDL
jgi:hypothetical protein